MDVPEYVLQRRKYHLPTYASLEWLQRRNECVSALAYDSHPGWAVCTEPLAAPVFTEAFAEGMFFLRAHAGTHYT